MGTMMQRRIAAVFAAIRENVHFRDAVGMGNDVPGLGDGRTAYQILRRRTRTMVGGEEFVDVGGHGEHGRRRVRTGSATYGLCTLRNCAAVPEPVDAAANVFLARLSSDATPAF